MANSWSAIILTGGTSARFGADKSEAILGGRALVDHLISALPDRIPIIVVGPERESFDARVLVTQETPAFSGPVAAIAAGIKLVKTELVAVFATDMPFGPLLIPQLMASLNDTCEAVLPLDGVGFAQPLCALYRVDALTRALLSFETVIGQSMRKLVAQMRVIQVPVTLEESQFLTDIDTQENLVTAQKSYETINSVQQEKS
jgi:molybdopterin-guanine dinucleotide biosynthesis protein A